MPPSVGGHAALIVGYDWRIVALSVFVACLAAYTALDLTGPAARAKNPRHSLAWTFAGTAALAIGVWSMHFIGMQAFRIAVPLQYNGAMVAASFILAIAGAMVSLWWLLRGAAKPKALLASSALLGVCLAGMHYTGMSALAMPAIIHYNAAWIAVSVIIASAASYAAFRLAGTFVRRDDLRAFAPKAITAAMLGVAIVSVHYTGMAAAHFYSSPGAMAMGPSADDVNQSTLALIVTGAACIVLALFLLSASINRRLHDREREELRFRMLAGSSPNMVWTLGESGAIEYANLRFTEYTGIPEPDGVLESVLELVHPDDRPAARQNWEAACVSGAACRDELRLRAADGTHRWHLVQVIPVRNTAGHLTGWLGTATDTHEQKQAHLVSKFLEEATHTLNASLELYPALKHVALLLCRYADWCEIQFQDATGERRSIPAGDVSDALDGEMWTRTLRADDRNVGRVTLVRSPERGAFTEVETTLFDHLALRIALAIAHANLYEREHRVAESFQQASLPSDLPHIPGVAFDAVYIAGGDGSTVGGDWYDAVRLMDGRVIISIGDVAGSGLEAAVTMGNVRQIIRGIAQVHADPGLMLDAADRALRIEHSERFVTAFVGVLDPITRTFCYASAGHPPPILRYPNGVVEMLSDGGLPLGLRIAGSGTAARTIELMSGCVLVLYTDGLTETHRTPVEDEERLREHIAKMDPLHAASPARSIRRAMLDGITPKDDVAILVMALADERVSTSVRTWRLDVTNVAITQTVRHEFAEELRARGFSLVDVDAAEIVLGELLGNTVRYAGGFVDVVVDWSGSAPVLHVLDRGPGFHHIAMLPSDLYSESGRGLFIVSSLTQDFRVSRREGGGSHARAVLTISKRQFAVPHARSLAKALVGQ